MKLFLLLFCLLIISRTYTMDLQKASSLPERYESKNPPHYSINMDTYTENSKLLEKKKRCCTSLKPYCPRYCTKFKDCCACTAGCCCGCSMACGCLALGCKFKIPIITWIVKEILNI